MRWPPSLALALMAASGDCLNAHPNEATRVVTTAPAAASETILTITSRIAGRRYRIQIFKPLLPPPPEGYPVIFVTDGSGMFRTAADQMWAREFGDLKPSLVIGLSQPTDDIKQFAQLRFWDLTPDRPNAAFMPTFKRLAGFAPVTVKDTGGAELFFRFITEELRPMLAKVHPINMHDQALFGHSLGGLFTLHVLFNHPTAFDTYIASSPSLNWNAGSVLRSEPFFSTAVTTGSIRPRVLLVKGSLEPDTEVQALADRLKVLTGAARFEFRFHIFEGENHGSVTAAAIARALTFAFSKPPPVPTITAPRKWRADR